MKCLFYAQMVLQCLLHGGWYTQVCSKKEDKPKCYHKMLQYRNSNIEKIFTRLRSCEILEFWNAYPTGHYYLTSLP